MTTTIWRVSNHETLDGAGGLRASGRWHTRGRRIVYCAPNPATALLEILVHAEIDLEDLPASYRYLEIEIPDETPRETLDPANLPPDWQTRLDLTRSAGDAWLDSLRTPLLIVPSVIVPETRNTLLNPHHPATASVRIRRIHTHPFDPRLL